MLLDAYWAKFGIVVKGPRAAKEVEGPHAARRPQFGHAWATGL
jgi:hypothetical protein